MKASLLAVTVGQAVAVNFLMEDDWISSMSDMAYDMGNQPEQSQQIQE